VTYLQLLKGNANFRRLWTGQVVSEIGDWLNNIAVLALAIQAAGAGHEGRALAIYAIARHLPLFLFGPVAGVVVDRLQRRRVMIAADITRAILALGFLLAGTVFAALPVIYIVGATLFAVSAFFNAAKRATIPTLVHDSEGLLAANSLSASTTAATIAVGSALGGMVATFIGRNPVFILNAATFLLSAEMIRRIKVKTVDESKAVESVSAVARVRRVSPFNALRRAFLDFREGLRYVRRVRVLSAIFIVAAGWGLGNGVARALYSIFGARRRERGARLSCAPDRLRNLRALCGDGFGRRAGSALSPSLQRRLKRDDGRAHGPLNDFRRRRIVGLQPHAFALGSEPSACPARD
jgi:MFS family permease